MANKIQFHNASDAERGIDMPIKHAYEGMVADAANISEQRIVLQNGSEQVSVQIAMRTDGVIVKNINNTNIQFAVYPNRTSFSVTIPANGFLELLGKVTELQFISYDFPIAISGQSVALKTLIANFAKFKEFDGSKFPFLEELRLPTDMERVDVSKNDKLKNLHIFDVKRIALPKKMDVEELSVGGNDISPVIEPTTLYASFSRDYAVWQSNVKEIFFERVTGGEIDVMYNDVLLHLPTGIENLAIMYELATSDKYSEERMLKQIAMLPEGCKNCALYIDGFECPADVQKKANKKGWTIINGQI